MLSDAGSCCVLVGSWVVMPVLQQKKQGREKGNVQGGEHIASDAGEVDCNEGVNVAIARMRETRTLIHDAKHWYQVLVVVLIDSTMRRM
jgi:hypothetical protein